MEITAIQKNITHSPRKVRLVTDMIRKMKPDQALLTLKFVNRAAALPLAKAIETALANAGDAANLNLSFKKIEINEGYKLKRFRPGSKGRALPYKRRMSQIKIVLTDEVIAETKSEVRARGNKAIKKAPSKLVESEVVETVDEAMPEEVVVEEGKIK